MPTTLFLHFLLLDELIIAFSSSAIALYISPTSFLLIHPPDMASSNFSELSVLIFLLSVLVLNSLSLALVLILCISLNLFFFFFGAFTH